METIQHHLRKTSPERPPNSLNKRRPKAIEKIKQLAGAVFSRLFVPTISFRPVENFRDEARALLPKAEANKLIKLCQSESAPRVSFETAERNAVAA
jgi:hypothetical protein